MSKKILFLSVSIVFFNILSMAQFTKEEIAEFKKWEEFLTNAEIVSSRPWEETPAVTDPWVLTLEKDGITKQAMWKNPEGRQKGSLEGWKCESICSEKRRLLAIVEDGRIVFGKKTTDHGIYLWISFLKFRVCS